MIPRRWQKKLDRAGAYAHVLELASGGWRVLVLPAGMCQEPLYRPPAGLGVALAREEAFKVALREYEAAVATFPTEAWKTLFAW